MVEWKKNICIVGSDFGWTVYIKLSKLQGWRRGETRSGTEKRCSHNLQGGHLAWWSADNCNTFSKVNNSGWGGGGGELGSMFVRMILAIAT